MDGVPQPEYTVHPGDIMIKFTAPEDRIIYSGKRVTERVTEKESEVLNLLKNALCILLTLVESKQGMILFRLKIHVS